jgi:hypothetical protein
MTSRTVSSSAATRRAIAVTGVPDEDARMIVARRTRIGLPRPRRTSGLEGPDPTAPLPITPAGGCTGVGDFGNDSFSSAGTFERSTRLTTAKQ